MTKTIKADPQRTPEAIKARAETMDAIVGTAANLLSQLYFRWQDEREYEDFAEYAQAMEQNVLAVSPAGTVFIKGTKRPFGCVIQVTGFPYKSAIFVIGKGIGWKPVV